MDAIVMEAAEHIRLEKLETRRLKFTYPRLTADVVGLYRDLRVDLGDLLTFYPEFLDVRTEMAVHALFTGFEEGAIGLFETNRAICRAAISAQGASDNWQIPWECDDNRPYLRSLREHAHSLCQLGRSQEAILLAREVVRHDPQDQCAGRAVLARALLQSGRHARVLELTGAPQRSNNMELCLAKVLACLGVGWEEEAFYTLAEAYRSWPATVEEVIRPGRAEYPPESLIYPVSEGEQAARYWMDYGKLWEETTGALGFVRRFLGARA